MRSFGARTLLRTYAQMDAFSHSKNPWVTYVVAKSATMLWFAMQVMLLLATIGAVSHPYLVFINPLTAPKWMWVTELIAIGWFIESSLERGVQEIRDASSDPVVLETMLNQLTSPRESRIWLLTMATWIPMVGLMILVKSIVKHLPV